MKNELTWSEAIKKVLEKSSVPLHYTEITDLIISEGFKKKIGATPASSVSSTITQSIKNQGEKSPYVRVSSGVFTLQRGSTRRSASKIAEPEDTEEQYKIITSFGMFWRKDEVDWKSEPKLLGMQQIEATPVDFNKQFGIYLLYDGREVIYVGRTTDRALGRRLYEHTLDRLSARWNRFSWFGLRPVSSEGKLGSLPENYGSLELIPTLEAVLIEALEPRQNRKRGDDLGAVEYIQKVDPDINKKRVKALLEDALNK